MFEDLIDDEAIHALSEWVRYHDDSALEDLRRVRGDLRELFAPPRYRGLLYRGMELGESDLMRLKEGRVIAPAARFESWTSDLRVARSFGNAVFATNIAYEERIVQVDQYLQCNAQERETVCMSQCHSSETLFSVSPTLLDLYPSIAGFLAAFVGGRRT